MVFLMSGILSLYREGFSLYSGKAESMSAFWVCILLAFTLSAFFTWWQEHSQVQLEIGKNSKPEIKGKVLRGFLDIEMDALGTRNICNTVICLHLSLVNHRDVPTTVESYVLKMKLDEGLQTTTGDANFSLGTNISPEGRWREPVPLIPIGVRITSVNPLRRAIAQDGWVCFHFSGSKRSFDKSQDEDLILTVTDALGGVHEIACPRTRLDFGIVDAAP
jgi:hypothetical protein